MKKILLFILCFCVILSLLTFNCFAGNCFVIDTFGGINANFSPTDIWCKGYYASQEPNDAVTYCFSFDGVYTESSFNEIYFETQSGEYWTSNANVINSNRYLSEIYASNYEGDSLTFTPTFYFNQPFTLNSNTDGILWHFSADNYNLPNDDLDHLVGTLSFHYSYYDIDGVLHGANSGNITLDGNYVSDTMISAPIPNIIKSNIPGYNSYSRVIIDNLYVELNPDTYSNFNGFDYCSFWFVGDSGTRYDVMPEQITITQEVVNPNILYWVVTSLNSFFDVSIFGDITIGNIFGIALAVPLVLWFLKLFAGG